MVGDTVLSDTLTAGSGFSLITSQNGGLASEFKTVSATQSGLSVPFTMTDHSSESGTDWSMIGDAVQAASTPTPPIPEYPYGLTLLAILLVIGYGLVRRRINY